MGRLLDCVSVFRRSREQLSPVGKTHTTPVCGIAAVFRPVPLDNNFIAWLQRVLSPPGADQRIGITGFDHPPRDRALRILRIECDPPMRIDQFPLHDNTGQRDRFCEVILRIE